MAGVTAQGGTFTYASSKGSFNAKITSLAVESPQAEVVDMTPVDAAVGMVLAVPTDAWTGGSISVDFISEGADPQSVVRSYGPLTFASAGHNVTRNVILESATTDAKVGDIVRGTLKFRLTDYTG